MSNSLSSAVKKLSIDPNMKKDASGDEEAHLEQTPLSPKSPNALARRRLSVMPHGKIPLNKVDGHGVEEQSELKSPVHKTEAKEQPPFKSFASRSKTGYIPFNPSKVNQDRLCEIKRLGNDDTKAFFGVFDGHGMYGDEVSGYVSSALPQFVAKQKKLEADPVESLKKAFLECNNALSVSQIDSSFSGSTGVTCFITGRTIFAANVGDSRIVMGQVQKDGSYKAFPLSEDHKPDRADEKKRIVANKGRVEACKASDGSNIGPARVWLLHQDVPGLAMSRSFGDMIAASVGVIAEPDVTKTEIGDNDKFLILASDGVWEFISSQEAVEIAAKAGSPDEACQFLVEESVKRWKKEEEVIDDITCLVVYL